MVKLLTLEDLKIKDRVYEICANMYYHGVRKGIAYRIELGAEAFKLMCGVPEYDLHNRCICSIPVVYMADDPKDYFNIGCSVPKAPSDVSIRVAGEEVFKYKIPYGLNDYQNNAAKTDKGYDAAYYYLQLMREAAEVAEHFVQREYKRGNPFIGDIDEIKELGDVLWFVAVIAKKRGYTLQQVAEHNIKKLEGRYGG